MNYEDAYFAATDKLLHGRLLEGFREYEVRWKTAHQAQFWRNYTEPQWTGQSLDGKTVFVWKEQGFGDSIMMHRYIRKLEKLCTVKVGVQPQLSKLFAYNLNSEVISDERDVSCDYHIPTLSLPYAFGTTLGTIPPPYPIRHDKPFLMDMPGINVGIQWAGNINHPDDVRRSIAFSDFSRLLKVKGIKFWGIQRNIRPDEVLAIQDSGLQCLWFDGFEVLAAIVDRMDLIITCDSALAHLAGAMGKPVWTLIQHNPDWRWMLNRTDTPWYPSMRLFRQRREMHWKPVIDHIVELLKRKRDNGALSKPNSRSQGTARKSDAGSDARICGA